jgi:hypothetical protein
VWGRGEVLMGILVGRLDGKSPLKDLGKDGKIILKWIFK